MKKRKLGIAEQFHLRPGALTTLLHVHQDAKQMWKELRTALAYIETGHCELRRLYKTRHDETSDEVEWWEDELVLQKAAATQCLKVLSYITNEKFQFPLMVLTEEEWCDTELVGKITAYLCQCVDKGISEPFQNDY